MRIDYNILWFENERSAFNSLKEIVKGIVEEFGFNFPEPKNEINGDNIETINYDEYDLLIVDLKLAGTTGTSLIDKIRNQEGVYTEVVFYSSDGERAVRDALKNFEIDGAYCADRNIDDFEPKVKRVIKTTIKKVQDLNNMRGLIMAETSDMDELMRDILTNFFNSNHPADAKEALRKSICDKIIESLNGNLKQITKICEQKDPLKLINHRAFDADKISRTLHELINGVLKEDSLSELNNFYSEYKEEISVKRNRFGHVKEKIVEGKIVLESHIAGEEPEIFTEEFCRVIRESLKKHKGRIIKVQKRFE